MSKPLEGIKVIEIAQEIQGPFAGLCLSDRGADVVKIENKETGDLSRWMLTALIGGPEVKNATVSHYFIAMNRGKRSITADLKKPDAIEIIRKMLKSYDVLVTNYRPGVLERLGLGYDEARKLNPRIVYAQGSSWGPRGPWGGRASGDTLPRGAGGSRAERRYARAGGERRDGEDGNAVRPAAGGRDVRRGSFGSAQSRGRDSGGAVRARADRQGAEGRCVDIRHDDRDAGNGDQLYVDHRERAGARRPGASVFARRMGRVPDQRRTHLHRGRG